jgi:hypothetical protein
VSHCHSSPKVCIVAYYFTRRCANYKITTYSNTYRPSLQLSCVAQTYPVNGFSFSGNQTATAIVNENIFWLYWVFRRMYEFPSKILFNSVSPGTILWLARLRLYFTDMPRETIQSWIDSRRISRRIDATNSAESPAAPLYLRVECGMMSPRLRTYGTK